MSDESPHVGRKTKQPQARQLLGRQVTSMSAGGETKIHMRVSRSEDIKSQACQFMGRHRLSSKSEDIKSEDIKLQARQSVGKHKVTSISVGRKT